MIDLDDLRAQSAAYQDAAKKKGIDISIEGTGKSFAMANIILEIQRPTLVLAHNKTLAAQLCSEFQG